MTETNRASRSGRLTAFLQPDTVFILLLLAYALLGVFLLRDYGEAWDNVWMFRYGRQTLAIYGDPFANYSASDYGPVDLRYFGPLIVTLAALASQVASNFVTTWNDLEIHRYVYFLTYLPGLAFFYPLCKRFMSDWVALVTTALFATQPLFFGQALINPKDTPFMGLFIGAVYAGMRMVDELGSPVGDEAEEKGRIEKPLLLWLAAVAALLLFRENLRQVVSGLVEVAFQATDTSLLGRLFDAVAPNASATALAGYQDKAANLLGLLAFIALALTLILILARFETFPKGLVPHLKNRKLIIAAVLLGLSVSIRVIGIAAGGLVAVMYLLKDSRRKEYSPLFLYFGLGLLVTYLSWPFLWPDPMGRFLESVAVNFGHTHQGSILFNGVYYAADEVPESYLPRLMAIQLTEPVVLLGAAGIVYLAAIKKTSLFRDYAAASLYLWLFVPLLAAMVIPISLHDNLRHFYFVIPPLIIFCGIMAEKLMQVVTQAWARTLLVATILLPGILAIIQLHPYEYIYFNSFAGGVEGASGRYIFDYLAITERETFAYINATVEPNATIYVFGPIEVVRAYARPDLILTDAMDNPSLEGAGANAYLTANYAREDVDGWVTIYEVVRDNAVLGVVQKYVGEGTE